MASRKPIVGANWKCNGNRAKVEELCKAFNDHGFDSAKCDVVITPAALHLAQARSLLKEGFQVGSQNCSAHKEGAFTGEWTCGQVLDMGYTWTLIGHSERRHKFGETNEILAEKMQRAQEAGINVIFCIGELLEERQANKTMEVCKTQMQAVMPVIKDWSKVVIAYEPVWAIGTGVVATPEQAQEAQKGVRDLVAASAGKTVADAVRIQYGGSVTPENCKELIALPDVDGFLVGGASLKPSFTQIIDAACAA